MFNCRSIGCRSLTAIIFLIIQMCINFKSVAQDLPSITIPSITIPYSAHHTSEYSNYYYEEALKLALAKTEAVSGKLDIKFYTFSTGLDRQHAILKTNGGLDLIWSTSTPLREEKMLAIKFNLLRELSDYRLLLIRKEDKAKFAAVKRLADLRKFKAGAISEWQDTKIFQMNNMPFVTAWGYEPMFKMLAEKRFDYILRGPQEIWPELEQHKDLPIMAEEQLLVSYELPIYFFVHPKNEKLAVRIKKGLELAQKDGSLKKLFMSVPAFKKGYEEINKNHRTLINMNDEDSFQ